MDEGAGAGPGTVPGSSVGRPAGAATDLVQRLIDRLGADLGLAVSVDDESFRLQFYSPQQGTLDRVRIESILLRDSPEGAKDWVRAHGVASASGPTRIPPAPDLGLLSRVCTPITHQGSLLGYLWIIDEASSLDAERMQLVHRCAVEIGPALYRRRVIDRLDRQAERDALADLIHHDPDVRARGVAALGPSRGGSTAAARMLMVRPVRAERVDRDEVELALELALEQARGMFPPGELRFIRRDREAIVLLTGVAAERAVDESGSIGAIQRSLRQWSSDARVVIGVGRLVRGLESAVVSAGDARDAAAVAAHDDRRPDVLEARWLGAYRLLLGRSPDELGALAGETLGPLLEHRDAGVLLHTLQEFLERGGEVVAVARVLGIHRSSVYGRLERISELLGADLGDGEIRLALHLAVLARSLTDGAGRSAGGADGHAWTGRGDLR